MVIQRWQSIYLFVATVLMAVYAFLPIAGFFVGNESYEFSTLGVECIKATEAVGYEIAIVTWPLFVVELLVAVISLITIFKFKKLKLQKTLCAICIIMTLALIVSLAIMSYNITMIQGASGLHFYMANCLPVLCIILYAMAMNGISKDQKTLRSYDRIR